MELLAGGRLLGSRRDHRHWRDSPRSVACVCKLRLGSAGQPQLCISSPSADFHGSVDLVLGGQRECRPEFGEHVSMVVADSVSSGDDPSMDHSIRCVGSGYLDHAEVDAL